MRVRTALLFALFALGCADTSKIDNAPKAEVAATTTATEQPSDTGASEEAKETPAEAVSEETEKATSDTDGAAVAEDAPEAAAADTEGATADSDAEEEDEEPETQQAPEQALSLDAKKSEIKFLGAKVTKTHDGGFKGFTGELGMKNGLPTSLAVKVSTSTLWADHPKLEKHLKSADFLNVSSHANSSFKADSFTQQEDGSWKVAGKLTILGKTNAISFPATVESGGSGTMAVDAEFQINRKDWGIVYPGSPDDLIKDEVLLTISLSFSKAT
jgi:polyisoprenoid-binding protein YceI